MIYKLFDHRRFTIVNLGGSTVEGLGPVEPVL